MTTISTTCQHDFRPGEVRCQTCPAHRVDCDCSQCQPAVRQHPAWCRGNDHPHECQPLDAGGPDEFYVHLAILFGQTMQDEAGSVSVELVESTTGRFAPYARVIADVNGDGGLTPARARLFAAAILEAANLADRAA